MAFLSVRLRGAVALSSVLLRHPSTSSHFTSTFVPLFHSHATVKSPNVLRPSGNHQFNFSASFRSSSLCLDRRSESGEGKISPDEILFEGCDYNHWLITMDFPKDPKPTPEQMVETYVETLSKVVGREEAMKRMYACSTTTYNGFQAVMTEEMSEKFRGLPGVVFILPDSYIDPVNKEYGGDKYEMGKITPRPPPVQYGRQGRFNDRNRNYDRPRYDRPNQSAPMQHANPPYNNQGPSQGGGLNYGQQQTQGHQGHLEGDGRTNAQQQPNKIPGQQGQQWQSPMHGHGVNHPRESTPMQHANPPYNNQGTLQSGGTNYGHQQMHSPQVHLPSDGQNYAQQQPFNPQGHQSQQWQSPTQGHGVNHTPQQNYNQGERGGPPSSYQREFNQDTHGNYATQGKSPEGQFGGPGSFGSRGFTQGPNSNRGQYSGPQEGQTLKVGENRGDEQFNINTPGNFGKSQGQF